VALTLSWRGSLLWRSNNHRLNGSCGRGTDLDSAEYHLRLQHHTQSLVGDPTYGLFRTFNDNLVARRNGHSALRKRASTVTGTKKMRQWGAGQRAGAPFLAYHCDALQAAVTPVLRRRTARRSRRGPAAAPPSASRPGCTNRKSYPGWRRCSDGLVLRQDDRPLQTARPMARRTV
jgi:hypothetical protein